jgi:hypothetical protein
MYKHKPGIQMDEHGFSESKNITGQKVEDFQHMIYNVLEPMLLNQEKEDKKLSFRLDGHGGSILDNLRFPSKHLIFNYKHRKSNHVYELKITDVSVGFDKKGNNKLISEGLPLTNGTDLIKKCEKAPKWVWVKKDAFYFFRKPKFKLGNNYDLQCNYCIKYNDCKTQNQFIGWVEHLNAKSWVTKTMLSQFMKLADKLHKEKTGLNLTGNF